MRNSRPAAGPDRQYTIDLSYITARGPWYFTSWKGNIEKSGGIATNIGVHFFDMLLWIFGAVQHQEVHYVSPSRMAGFLELEQARVRWFLSVDRNDLPPEAQAQQQPASRSIIIDGQELEFSGGFTDLHTQSYADILAGRGFGLADARPSIQLVSELRQAQPALSENKTVHPRLRDDL